LGFSAKRDTSELQPAAPTTTTDTRPQKNAQRNRRLAIILAMSALDEPACSDSKALVK
jgi:hypothetical protein